MQPKGVADLALRWDNSLGAADLQVVANDLGTSDSLETAVLLSLMADRLAPADAALPSGDGNRRGWWADLLATPEGDQVGSHLWLLGREAQRASVLERARRYAEAALAWLVEDGVAASVSVEATFPRAGWLQLAAAVDLLDRRFAAAGQASATVKVLLPLNVA